MTLILLRIGAAAFFSLSSLLVIVFRVSPLTAPGIAIPLFFLTLGLSVASIASLLSYTGWHFVALEGMDAGKKLSVALREGIFLAIVIVLIFLFQVLGILTWWIGALIFFVFLLIEVALHS